MANNNDWGNELEQDGEDPWQFSAGQDKQPNQQQINKPQQGQNDEIPANNNKNEKNIRFNYSDLGREVEVFIDKTKKMSDLFNIAKIFYLNEVKGVGKILDSMKKFILVYGGKAISENEPMSIGNFLAIENPVITVNVDQTGGDIV